MNFFQFTNYNGDGGPVDTGNWQLPRPHGAPIWISTGAGAYEPVLNTQDLNFELDYRSTPTSPWVTLTGAYLLSNGVAFADVTAVTRALPPALSGVLDGHRRRRRWDAHPDSTSPYPLPSKGPGMYYLPGTQPTGSPPLARGPRRGCSSTCMPGPATTTASLPPPEPAPRSPSAGHSQWAARPTTTRCRSPRPPSLYMPAMVLAVPGDATYDGKVDINDLTIVLAGLRPEHRG